MKNLGCSVLIFLLSYILHGQNDIKVFCADKMFQDDYSNCKWNRNKPFGREITVKYDTFFKSYEIIWTDEKEKKMN